MHRFVVATGGGAVIRPINWYRVSMLENTCLRLKCSYFLFTGMMK